VSYPKFHGVSVFSLLALSVGAFIVTAQQTQAPPPQPPPGAANGPQPGPAVQQPGPGDRKDNGAQQEDPARAGRREAVRNFLALGKAPDPQAVERGHSAFVSNCGFCHGTNARGGATGPDLVRSVLVLHDEGTGKEIGPVIRNGRPAKGMPSFNMTDAQIGDLGAFLLSRTQAAANRMEYQIQNIVTGDPKAGQAYFGEHCASCHSPTGDLAHIASKYDEVALQSRFLYPRAHESFGSAEPVDPRQQRTVEVKLPNGKTYSGTLDRIDDFSVSLTNSAGEHQSWLFDAEPGIQVKVHDPLKEHAELLPKYSNADMHNMLAYLETLK
jgi:mono/diheme cytochrome c family protein